MGLYYEDFGAVGDGIHDDFRAIIKCHEAANKSGEKVFAKDGAVYYIGGSADYAVIKTDVDWGKATIIIDDICVENRMNPVFLIEEEKTIEDFTISVPIKKETKRIENPFGHALYVRIYSDEKKRFIRKGLNKNPGVDQNDCFYMDENGYILTDIDWDYDSISLVKASYADDRPISVKGGVFKTKVNHDESFYNYYKRGIYVHRSNVTVEGVSHYVLDEIDHGAPYDGFIFVEECANVTLKNCFLTPHYTYWTVSKVPGKMVPMGSYDIRANSVVNFKLEGITQSIDINKKEYWGLMVSNFCKNMEIRNCVMSRYDAHMGVTNLYISDCVFGHVGINLIGHGSVEINNTKSYGAYYIGLREDYGANFDGDIKITGGYWKPSDISHQDIIWAKNEGDHDFGYECYMAKSISIKDFVVDDEEIENIYILPDYDNDYEKGKPYAYKLPDSFEFENVRTTSGRTVKIYKNKEEYDHE